jgi:hypothetical protein
LASSAVKSIQASQLAAAPFPVSAAVAANSASNKEGDGATMMPIETNFVPSIEEIY